MNAPRSIPVKIVSYSDKPFKNEAYYNGEYKNVFYACIGFGRPSVTTTKEVEEDELKIQTIQYQNAVTEINFSVWAHNNLIDYLSHVELEEVIELTIIETGEVLILNNVRTEDAGDRGEQLEGFTFFAQLAPVIDTACAGNYEIAP